MNVDGFRDHPVRSYVLTGGRAHPSRNTLRPETLVCAALDDGREPPRAAGRHEQAVLDTCQGTLAVAEIAAYLRLPVSLSAVIVSDLVDAGHLVVRSGVAHGLPDTDLLEEILDGLRKL
jgi:hypothetical protein